MTTGDQVRGLLGVPANTRANMDTGGERFDEWIYYFASGKLAEVLAVRVKMLQIKFDKQGIVHGYNWSSTDQ